MFIRTRMFQLPLNPPYSQMCCYGLVFKVIRVMQQRHRPLHLPHKNQRIYLLKRKTHCMMSIFSHSHKNQHIYLLKMKTHCMMSIFSHSHKILYTYPLKKKIHCKMSIFFRLHKIQYIYLLRKKTRYMMSKPYLLHKIQHIYLLRKKTRCMMSKLSSANSQSQTKTTSLLKSINFSFCYFLNSYSYGFSEYSLFFRRGGVVFLFQLISLFF